MRPSQNTFILLLRPEAPEKGAKYCDQRLHVKHQEIFCMLSVVCGLGSHLATKQHSMLCTCTCTSGFGDNVMLTSRSIEYSMDLSAHIHTMGQNQQTL